MLKSKKEHSSKRIFVFMAVVFYLDANFLKRLLKNFVRNNTFDHGK